VPGGILMMIRKLLGQIMVEEGFIQKPFYMTDLSKKIREILDKD
jgi:hypothetical protein